MKTVFDERKNKTMSCPFINCIGYNEIDCNCSNFTHVKCPLHKICDDNKLHEEIFNYICKALETEEEARELHNKLESEVR